MFAVAGPLHTDARMTECPRLESSLDLPTRAVCRQGSTQSRDKSEPRRSSECGKEDCVCCERRTTRRFAMEVRHTVGGVAEVKSSKFPA
ncbi:hypothetical protein K458DRAFT_190445 [Lentithecium fluviatile CBS 122367]|uniref:Uncharacterized protein n=1 Tax=Lentithecium fluviatile CBS 122367 TaxID=1168545 RepID=A0A6G1JA57_9PLEO|nr:hypothetical protein K458DRAFT_190445 [Lentithecium fluviatile CBS 122367]